ncbi:MAG: acetylxylan esterase, partial [Phycisphaeraceae bacterium]
MSLTTCLTNRPIAWLGLILLQCVTFSVAAQKFVPNYDESKVPEYTLSGLLVDNDGEPVTTAAQWAGHRRGEVLALFEEHMFGALPGNPFTPKVEVLESTDDALDGLARRSQVRVTFSQDKPDVYVDLLIHTPADVDGPVPTFVTLNFQGNHTTQSDPAINISKAWIRSRGNGIVTNNRANEKGRGVAANRWPVES